MKGTDWEWWIVLTLGLAACVGQTQPGNNPLTPLPTLDIAMVQQGKEVYQANCAACHGAEAEGAPNWATPKPDGLFPAPPHDDSGHTWHHSDRVLYETIYGGLGDPLQPASPLRMPAFGDKLSDEEIRAVIEYFKSLWSEEHRRWQREETLKDFAPTPTPSRDK
jgi:mono/diheme cytochrome c family protein